jgi:hypothetical protein
MGGESQKETRQRSIGTMNKDIVDQSLVKDLYPLSGPNLGPFDCFRSN